MRVFALLALAALAQAKVIPAVIEDKFQEMKQDMSSVPDMPNMSDVLPRDCAPGTYQCWTGLGINKDMESGVQVCNTSGSWITSAICGGAKCCSESDGKAWCKC